ncbi:MAG: tetraacyldisaccharide 4'-kinase [Bacteroidetes bacterium]|nr:MAG: tetraacyldisaccharide 4'-kinase [Bacteroidota bacterium]
MVRSKRYTWKIILLPFSWLYGLAVTARNALYDSGLLPSDGFLVPVISVGNITAGGTGKTPHVEYLAELLSPGFEVAVLSRGYRRKTRDFRIVSAGSTAREVGDEPLQFKNRFPEMIVAVDRDRAQGIRKLMELDPAPGVILLDDAFQHRRVKPGLSILLIDYNRPLHRDFLLPAGMLREPGRNRRRATMFVVTRSPGSIQPTEKKEYFSRLGKDPGGQLYFTTMRYGDLVPVFEGIISRDREWYRENACGVLIVTGIANPGDIWNYALGIHTRTREIRFPDHHHYRNRDLERISAAYDGLMEDGKQVLLLTTEKDAMRFRCHELRGDIRENMHAVRIHVEFLNQDHQNFDRQILNYVSSNRRGSILHQGKD